MKIWLDGTPLAYGSGGIRRYTDQLYRALREHFPEDDVDLAAPGAGRWWSFGLPRSIRAARVDLFHGVDFAAPYRRVCASVMTIHDLSPWRPETQSETSPRIRRRTPWLLRLGRVDHVITPTEAVRREAKERFGLADDRVTAVPLGAPDWPVPETSDSARRRFLCVSGGKRKNLDIVREAAAELGEELVEMDGGVPEEQVAGLYGGAIALLMPSLYEGFGLPLVEAMHCGAPVIASTDAALREVSGGAAMHVDPHDARGWREAMECLRKDPGRQAALREAGRRRARDFSWEKTARMTRAVYDQAHKRHGR